jgi:peptidoglycan/xylan/chitin deacetylase (PgdA/CDA1 family)
MRWVAAMLVCGCASPESSAPPLAVESAAPIAPASSTASASAKVTTVAAPQPSASARVKNTPGRRCELPEPDPPPKRGGAQGASAKVSEWVAADGSCSAPREYRPWSWSMLRRVRGLRKNAVVLTVDGGHNIEVTRAGLDVLKEYGLHATYFLTTSELQKQGQAGSDLVQRIANEGHEIANHSATHPHLTKLGDSEVRGEIEKADTWLEEVLGFAPKPFFRPPFLDHDDRVGEILKDLCYRPVWFTVYSRDDEARITADDISEAVLCDDKSGPRKFERGSILMFHGSQKETVKAWPVIFTALAQRKIEVMPLGEAMREAAEVRRKKDKAKQRK